MRAYHETYGLPVTITNCANNYGPYQFPEKVIPLFTTLALDDQSLPLYASTENRREWIHVLDHCRAVERVLADGQVGETYHVGTGVEASIEQIADRVLAALGKPASLKTIVPDRPGHDRRYLLDTTKIRAGAGLGARGGLRPGHGRHRRLVRRQPVVVGAAAGTGAGGRVGLAVVRYVRSSGAGARHRRRRPAGPGCGGRPRGGRRPSPGHRPPTTRRLDVSDRDAVLQAIDGVGPDVVIHCAAWTAVDACEGDPDRAFAVNALGSRHVAEGARLTGAHLVYVSTDYVFDGRQPAPYVEWDSPNPLSVYGRSKLGGEREVQSLVPGATIVRTSWVCGAHGANMVKTILRLSAQHGELAFVDDQRGCPTFTEDLAAMIVRLSAARLPGVFHVTNQGPTTWYEFARDVVKAAGRDPSMVRPITTAELQPPRPAPRPANSVLDNAALRLQGIGLLADYHEPLERLVDQLQSQS